MKLKFTVTKEYNNKPAKFFLRSYCNISARTLISLKQAYMGITRNNQLLKVIDNVYEGDEVIISLKEDENEITPIKMDLEILYEDEHILVLDKPPFMPVHPTRNHQTDTLANGVANYMRQKNEFYKFRALNRLDRDTTGIVLLAKNSYAANNLKTSFSKVYYAVCQGNIKKNGRVDAPISLKEGHTIERIAGAGGVRAITNYEVKENANNHTLLKLNLETGRTHQIRVHMAYIGHPLAGDDMYGGSLKLINRQALHCGQCSFIHPIKNISITICSHLPNDIKSLLKP